jgi:hypothetical protein
MLSTALEIPDVRHLVSTEEWQVRLDLAAYRLARRNPGYDL